MLRSSVLRAWPVCRLLLRSMLPPDAGPDPVAPNPTGRLARPEEIAAFVAFLLSDECPFLTGAALAVDGGFTAQ
jgi:NAD(P)-dependent dehydrogenase (short-subunit alcohol dehydrogenase family)